MILKNRNHAGFGVLQLVGNAVGFAGVLIFALGLDSDLALVGLASAFGGQIGGSFLNAFDFGLLLILADDLDILVGGRPRHVLAVVEKLNGARIADIDGFLCGIEGWLCGRFSLERKQNQHCEQQCKKRE